MRDNEVRCPIALIMYAAAGVVGKVKRTRRVLVVSSCSTIVAAGGERQIEAEAEPSSRMVGERSCVAKLHPSCA